MKTNAQFKTWLTHIGACGDSILWVDARNEQQVWDECPRGDWLLWLCQKKKISDQLLTLAKGKCAETVIHLMKNQISKDAVLGAIAFGEGKITRVELNKLRDAADAAAYAAAYAAYAAADADAAAYAAADAAAYAAAYAAADAAADAAAYAAADAAAYAVDRSKARKANQLLTANIVRSIITPTWIK